jgi:pimeloyl-ACP methyl ester carboxylesterase
LVRFVKCLIDRLFYVESRLSLHGTGNSALFLLPLLEHPEGVRAVVVAEVLTELIPDARLEVLPAGHGPWLGHPERTAGMVADFVS